MKIATVTELNRYIKNRFDDDAVLANIWIKGEISNFKHHSSGHLYFTLKDEKSSLRVVMFRSRAGGLLFKPSNGMAIIIRGYVSVYERDGGYQLYAEEMQPDGLGALYLAFEQLKEMLQKEGLFAAERKLSLPKLPGTIALVTSPTGAAVRDMVKIIRRRWPLAEIILVPVLVQGKDAPADICRGIRQINDFGRADVILLGRGGGSIEELWAFNTESVARAIDSSKIPIVSAVGHETDTTIADYIADVRAATPSAAAEMAVPDLVEFKRYLESLKLRLQRGIASNLNEYRHRLQVASQNKCFLRPQKVLLDGRRQDIEIMRRDLIKNIHYLMAEKIGRIGKISASLQSLSPLATLSRGYSLCWDSQGNLIKDIDQVQTGDLLQIKLHQGKMCCEVKDK